MAFSQQQNLDVKLKQRIALTPQFQQAIKILNMNAQELSLEVSQMLSQNFMLNFEDDGLREERSEQEESEDIDDGLLKELGEDLPYDGEWEDAYEDWQDHGSRREENSNLEEFISHRHSLESYLLEQLEQMPISEELRRTAELLLYHLDEDGYLREPPQKLAKLYQLELNAVNKAIALIKNCQPTGVGAADLEECIHLQLEQLPPKTPHLGTLKRIMARHFLFIGKNPQLIQQRLNLSEQEYRQAIALLESLNPQPGQGFTPSNGNFIQPEIIVREKNNISYIEIDPSLSPSLSINEEYAAMIKHANEQEKTLLQAQLNEARWFLSAIDKRADIIRRVAGVIVALQQEFFQEGEKAMRPMTRQKIADMLDIHESTVSRAVNGKYLSCKRGVYELRYFFSTQLESTDGGEDQSTTAIKATITEMIAAENPKKPLSDQNIADRLAEEEGYKIARRTVAKYREELNIPTSTERKRR